ncbi:MAG: ABC transporter permease [Waddliaceae bacterium]|jgi:putative ABC transport system permease protein|nr:ABC transporter permease [Waddliaceae bacterium]MBT3579394.1 ABC transporter permease [Waddliaceae bacterium]MBT4444806.1 ABC transporter permease [Waddliaceae bacterium]MBT6928499.1 ABC transporter permease [Waddliaceae bacterium]MBT7264345.1 ABC transporter permease [Waddliaceae bacterium]
MKMLFVRFAFRNIFRQKRRSILTGLTIAVGFFLLSLSIGVSEGSYSEVIDIFTKSHTGHIQIHHSDYLDKPNLYKTIDEVDIPELSFMTSWTPRVYSSALAFGNNKTLGTQVLGIDLDREFKTTTLAAKLSEGTFSEEGAVITASLARTMKVAVGDDIVLISQGADGSIANDIFPISGIVKDEEGMMLCYLSIATAQEFLSLGSRVHEIAIMTDSYHHAEEYATAIRESIGDATLDIQPWQVVEKSFYDAMLMDIKGMWVSLSIIMLIVALGILNSVLMDILERTREYGVLKALGTSPAFIFKLIITEMFLLTTISVIIGAIPAFIANWFLAEYGIALSEPIEFGGVMFSTYRSAVSFTVFAVPAALTMATSLIVSIFPAIGILRKPAVEAMRHV